jgi:hypothetical protein
MVSVWRFAGVAPVVVLFISLFHPELFPPGRSVRLNLRALFHAQSILSTSKSLPEQLFFTSWNQRAAGGQCASRGIFDVLKRPIFWRLETGLQPAAYALRASAVELPRPGRPRRDPLGRGLAAPWRARMVRPAAAWHHWQSQANAAALPMHNCGRAPSIGLAWCVAKAKHHASPKQNGPTMGRPGCSIAQMN